MDGRAQCRMSGVRCLALAATSHRESLQIAVLAGADTRLLPRDRYLGLDRVHPLQIGKEDAATRAAEHDDAVAHWVEFGIRARLAGTEDIDEYTRAPRVRPGARERNAGLERRPPARYARSLLPDRPPPAPVCRCIRATHRSSSATRNTRHGACTTDGLEPTEPSDHGRGAPHRRERSRRHLGSKPPAASRCSRRTRPPRIARAEEGDHIAHPERAFIAEDLRIDGRILAEKAPKSDEAAQPALGGALPQRAAQTIRAAKSPIRSARTTSASRSAPRGSYEAGADRVSACDRSPEARNSVSRPSSSAHRRTSCPSVRCSS